MKQLHKDAALTFKKEGIEIWEGLKPEDKSSLINSIYNRQQTKQKYKINLKKSNCPANEHYQNEARISSHQTDSRKRSDLRKRRN